MSVVISQLKDVGAQEYRDIQKLLKQLSASGSGTTLPVLRKFIAKEDVEVWVLRDGTKIIGMATLLIIQMLSGPCADVEDVVVDETYRGQGCGTMLMEKLIARARIRKCDSIDLTSRPSRIAAHALYIKLGFVIRDTSVFRLKLNN